MFYKVFALQSLITRMTKLWAINWYNLGLILLAQVNLTLNL